MSYTNDKPDLASLSDFLLHYGVGHLKGGHSGRYPWGSGDDPSQHNAGDFISRVKAMRKANVPFTDDRKFLKDSKGNDYPNPDYGKTFYGDTAIAKAMDMSTKEFRAYYTIAYNEEETKKYNRILELTEAGKTPTEIGKMLGMNESSVRSKLKSSQKDRQEQCQATADFIKSQVDEKGMIQVGSGVEKDLKITRNRFDTALAMLEIEGYPVYSGRVPQTTDPTGSKQSTIKVICPPGTEHKDIYNFGEIHSLIDYTSPDGGQSYVKKSFQYPASMDSSRLAIRYAEDGGKEKDGVIEIRRGVEDLSLGNDNYAQVRILVDKNRYLKGMAMYSDNLPDGVDVLFNTNKSKSIPKMEVLKKIKDDPDNPFGSSVREEGGQYTFINEKGKEQLGLINKTRIEGDWNDWSNKVPAQFLSKQTVQLAKNQLKLTIDLKKDELKEIIALENPTVKKELLNTFAEDCDSVAVHLKAVNFPRQTYQVILPVPSMKDNEVYAPNYKDGEQVALIRYPHGGTFEIPVLTVNNKKKVLGKDFRDCVGINSTVASQLSGADFDGDTVMVIPVTDKVRIKSRKPFEELQNFDMELEYGCRRKEVDDEGITHYYNAAGKEFKLIRDTQMEMGKISNLINDMTIKGATDEEIIKAVKHSMVIIDAAKHEYDYRSSEADNNIKALKLKYQGKSTGGAATIISRAKSPLNVDKRQGSPRLNTKLDKNGKPNPDYDPSKPEGSLLYKTSDDVNYLAIKTPSGKYDSNGKEKERWATVYERDGKYYYNKSNDKNNKEYVQVDDVTKIKLKTRTQESTKMAETDDAYTLVSEAQMPMERLYADFANEMKSLANKARLEAFNTVDIPYSASAKATYSKEVDHLNDELFKAEKNAPREKQALLISNSRVQAKLDSNPDITKEEEKKIRQQELTRARNEVGAHRYTIDITDRDWEAIQAGAISPSKLRKILLHTDTDVVKERATPRSNGTLDTAKANRAKNMANLGYTAAQIADQLGISVSTVYEYIKED